MAKIKFTKPYRVKGATPEDSPSYKEGQVVEVSDASARHFINRGVAQDAAKVAVESSDDDDGYEGKTVAELHKLASDREIEGRSELTTKADLIKAIEKDDKAKAKAPAPAPKAAPPAANKPSDK